MGHFFTYSTKINVVRSPRSSRTEFHVASCNIDENKGPKLMVIAQNTCNCPNVKNVVQFCTNRLVVIIRNCEPFFRIENRFISVIHPLKGMKNGWAS